VNYTVPDYKIPLTEVGKQQSVEAGKLLRGKLQFGGFLRDRLAVYVSPYLRTRETWQNMKLGMDVPSYNIEREREDPRLREQEWGNLGTSGGSEKVEFDRNNYGTFFFRIPLGESGADVYDRCTGFLDTLYRDFENPEFPRNVLIVLHGFSLRVLLMRWLHLTVEEFETMKNPDNCQMFQLHKYDGKHYRLTEPYPKKDKL
jgi:broad specificity phosphatase PhoE